MAKKKEKKERKKIGLSPKQRQFMDSEADIVVFGGSAGSGKSFTSLVDFLPQFDDPNFDGVIFRRTSPQLKGANGLWDAALTLWGDLFFERNQKIRTNSQELKMTFPSGATCRFRHMVHVKDKLSIQGWEIARAFVDEGTQFELEQIMYIISRLRSQAKCKSQIKISCNPDADSYLRVWLEKAGFLDREGYPIETLSGKIVYCAQIENDLEFADTEEELKQRYPNVRKCMSFTFIPATCRDNPVLMDMEPDYISKLENLPRIERARLLHGNWFVRQEAAGHFKREWCGDLLSAYQVPRGGRIVRSWDKAATLPSESYPDPDFTVGMKGTVCPTTGELYILDMVRFRERPAQVQETILRTALADSPDCVVTIPRDSGAAGKAEAMYSSSALFERGITCKQKPSSHTSKLKAFEPVAALAENGMIKFVRGDWNEDCFNELEAFTGEARSRTHDDIADALADLVHELCMSKAIPSFGLPSLGGLTQTNPFSL